MKRTKRAVSTKLAAAVASAALAMGVVACEVDDNGGLDGGDDIGDDIGDDLDDDM